MPTRLVSDLTTGGEASESSTIWRIEPYFCPHALFGGWHLYLDGRWAARGTATADTVARLMGESRPFMSVCEEIRWWDGVVHRFVKRYPEGVLVRDGMVMPLTKMAHREAG